jgi:hypothetical protein
MPGIITNTARDWLLAMRIGRRQPERLLLKLFTNDPDLGRSMTAADLTEPVGQGYQPVALVPTNWQLRPATDLEAAVATYPTVTFSFTGPLKQPLRGYYIVGEDTGDLVGVESFQAARPVQFMGDQERVTVTLVQK